MTAHVWTVYRRPRDTDLPWRPFLGLKGTKRDCLAAMQGCERIASEVEYEYNAMPGDDRPPVAHRPPGWGR